MIVVNMINLCPISEERKIGFSAQIISDLPEFISSGGGEGKVPPSPTPMS